MNLTLKRLQAVAAALALGLPLITPAAAAPPAAGDADRWPLHTPADASLLRLPLPAAVLTRLQSADGHDLRIFNAAGQPVPMALARAASHAAAATAPPPITLAALPWHDGMDGADAAARAPLSLRVEPAPGRAVQLQVQQAPQMPPAPEDGAPQPLPGVLLDARAVQPAVTALTLEAEWPESRPVTFHVHASDDLRQWQPLGSVTAYRHGAFSAPARLALPGARLAGRYLRVTWQGQGEAGAVTVRGARLQPAATAEAAPAPRVAVPLQLPAPAPAQAGQTPQAVEFTLPFATPLAALDIRLPGPNHLAPLRVLARQQRGQPWTPLARHVAFTLTERGQVRHSPPVELGQASWRQWRIEAEAAAPGWPGGAERPQLTALLTPMQVIFMASGPGPYTLAAGQTQAPAAALPLSSLLPDHATGAAQRLPLARLESPLANGQETAAPASAASPPAGQVQAVVVQPPRSGPPPLRQMLLWAVLVLGALALGGMAWALLRQLDRRPPA
ncbi:DUF3999 family protein [Comamonadaceae bacterium OH2545_COT-014]|nr:DUF3999 family protein [Comamonadaceae bacterium OH2545_COT-014]